MEKADGVGRPEKGRDGDCISGTSKEPTVGGNGGRVPKICQGS